MIHRTKPTEWKLDTKSDEELLKLALNKLRQRTMREGEKMDKAFENNQRDEKQRSKFYSLWYAFEALRIYAANHKVEIEEPFNYEKPVHRIELSHYETGSTISLYYGERHKGSITYTRNIHQFESDNDFSNLNTEMKTYGDRALLELFDYYMAARNKK